jgi:hypothetical protein
MNFDPVRTLAELDTLDDDEILAGYREWHPGDPEPGPNRSKAYWHGWRNAAIDRREIDGDAASAQLAHEYVAMGRLKEVGRQLKAARSDSMES